MRRLRLIRSSILNRQHNIQLGNALLPTIHKRGVHKLWGLSPCDEQREQALHILQQGDGYGTYFILRYGIVSKRIGEYPPQIQDKGIHSRIIPIGTTQSTR